MTKKIALIFLSLLFSLLLIYLIVFTWVAIFEDYKKRNFFINFESLKYHKKYSDQIHHLRGNLPKSYKEKNIKKEDYFFTTFSKFTKEKQNYLMQGDSWAEYLTLKNNTIETLDNIIKIKNIGFINGGVSSYSPSTMKIQYEILERDYNIKPDYLITIIDQTDIGDELCRYKRNIINNEDGTVKYIKRERNTDAVGDYSKYYNFSNILFEKKSFVNFYVTNYYFYKTVKLFQSKMYFLMKDGFKNRNHHKCRFGQIQKYLFNIEEEDVKYFKKRTQEYLDFLQEKNYLKNIFIVTFPHEKHLTGEYKVNVSSIINELNLSEKINHINFTELIETNDFNSDNIYQTEDPASHLNEDAHSLFVKKIFELIELDLKK